jgi:hypothetical protein
MYLAGMLLATGASLALAGPASAHGTDGKCHNQAHFLSGYHGYNGYGSNDYYDPSDLDSSYYSSSVSNYSNSSTTMNGINVPILSSFGGGSLL